MEPIFKLTKETFTVRGIPYDWNSDRAEHRQTRLFLDEQEVPVPMRSLEQSYARYWTWGQHHYTEKDPAHRETVEAVANHFITDPDVAQRLWPLLYRRYLAHWPIDGHFTQTINILDFLLENETEIRQAQAGIQPGPVAKEQQIWWDTARPPAEDLTAVNYSPAAQTYWVGMPAGVPGFNARCRVDVFLEAGLVILTDVGSGSVENYVEHVVHQLCHQLGLSPWRIHLWQRYQQDTTLVNEVSFSTGGRGALIRNPDWHQRSVDEFWTVVNHADQMSKEPGGWLRGLMAGIINGFCETCLRNVPRRVGPRLAE